MVTKESVEDLSSLLDSISWGYRIVEVLGQTFAFRPLNLAERNVSTFVHEQALQKSIRDNIPTQDELMVKANSAGLRHPDRDEYLESLKEELEAKQEELDKARKIKSQKQDSRRIKVRETKKHSKEKIIERRIKMISDQIDEMSMMRANLIEFPSAEHQANHARAVHIVQCATLTFPGLDQKWPTLQDIYDTEETDLVFKLISVYNDHSVPDVSKVRALARSGLWRIRWTVAKSTGCFDQLFDVSLSDLTPEQMLLVHWSQVYDSAYEAYERPPDYIIEDDTEFDRWLERTLKEQEQERKKQFHSKKTNLGIGKASSSNANEVMVPVDGFYSDECNCGAVGQRGKLHSKDCPYGVYFYYKDDRKNEEIDRVHESNPDAIRIVLASETKALESKGIVREEHLRKYKGMARQVMGFGTNMHGKDGRG